MAKVSHLENTIIKQTTTGRSRSSSIITTNDTIIALQQHQLQLQTSVDDYSNNNNYRLELYVYDNKVRLELQPTNIKQCTTLNHLVAHFCIYYFVVQ